MGFGEFVVWIFIKLREFSFGKAGISNVNFLLPQNSLDADRFSKISISPWRAWKASIGALKNSIDGSVKISNTISL